MHLQKWLYQLLIFTLSTSWLYHSERVNIHSVTDSRTASSLSFTGHCSSWRLQCSGSIADHKVKLITDSWHSMSEWLYWLYGLICVYWIGIYLLRCSLPTALTARIANRCGRSHLNHCSHHPQLGFISLLKVLAHCHQQVADCSPHLDTHNFWSPTDVQTLPWFCGKRSWISTVSIVQMIDFITRYPILNPDLLAKYESNIIECLVYMIFSRKLKGGRVKLLSNPSGIVYNLNRNSQWRFSKNWKFTHESSLDMPHCEA